MIFRTHGAVGALFAAAAIFGAQSASAGIVDGDSYQLDTEILGLDLLGTSIDVTTSGTGDATPADDTDGLDIALAQVAADVGVDAGDLDLTTDLDLGVLGTEFTEPDTFDLVFNLDLEAVGGGAFQDTLNGILDDLASLTLTPTINWDLADLDLADGNVITGVTQIAGDDVLAASNISFTDDSISIDFDNLVGLEAELFGDDPLRATFQIDEGPGEVDGAPGVVPLPAAGWMLIAGVGALAARGRKRA